ncbi:MAG: hypothetical protein KBA61_17575 [Spirochaetes bacterium]|nr:hypothetical protein [Spirochaetota bacterium]
MKSLIAFMVTFAVAVPVTAAGAVFLAALRRRMRHVRASDAASAEKRIYGAIGAAASLAVPFLLPPVLYLASRGSDAAESAVIVAAMCGIFLSYFAVAALVSSVITALTARGKREDTGGADANADGAHGDTGGSA